MDRYRPYGRDPKRIEAAKNRGRREEQGHNTRGRLRDTVKRNRDERRDRRRR